MPTSLDGQLVVAISSRALFDFEEENQHFEANDDRAYPTTEEIAEISTMFTDPT